jgi:uncharacterized protein YuzE
MATSMMFTYDQMGDILYITTCPPYPQQESEELGDEIIARLNPHTNEVEGLEVLFFSTRLMDTNAFTLPITAHLKLAS